MGWYPIECCHGYDFCPKCDGPTGCTICGSYPKKEVKMPKKTKKAKKKDEIKVVFESENHIFTPVEREIIMADIAYLKQKEIESGDWDKWLESQRPFESYNRLRALSVEVRPVIRRALASGPITRERFCDAVGREPENDDLERSNCSEAGRMGHWSCGWCAQCDKPNFICGHGIMST